MRLLRSIVIGPVLMSCATIGFAQEGNLAAPAADSIPDDIAARQAPWGRSNIDVNRKDRIYTLGYGSDDISVSSPTSLSLLGTISAKRQNASYATTANETAAPSDFAGIGYSPSGKTLAVVYRDRDAVTFFDTRSNAVAHVTGFDAHPTGAYYTPNGGEVWVPVGGKNYIAILDGKEFNERARLGTGTAPGMTTFSNNGRYAFVCSDGGSETVVFDVRKRAAVASVPQGSSSCPSIAATPDGKQIWRASANSGLATVFSAKPPFKVLRHVDVGPRAHGVTFVSNDDGQFAYITVGSLNSVKVIDTQTFETVASIPVGSQPRGIWPSGDGSRVYVGSGRNGTLAVIDPASQSVVGSVAVGSPAVSVAYVPYAARSGSDLSGLDIGRR